MSFLDIALVIIIVAAVLQGFRSGFIFKIGSLAGNILGLYLAGKFYDVLSRRYLSSLPVGQLVVFGVIQFATAFVLGLAFRVLSKIFNLIAIIPGLKLINKTGGAVVGFVEVILVLGVLIFVADKLSGVSPFLTDALTQSRFVPILRTLGSYFAGMLPASLLEINNSNNG